MRQNQENLTANRWTILSLFLLSAVLIAIQLVLMRSLSILRYHHFSYLVISTALLGFGASGTFLTFFFNKISRSFLKWTNFFFLIFIISIPVCYLASNLLPIDTQYVLFSTRQQFLTLLYNFLLFVPFFFGAVLIGIQLTYFSTQANLLYGANLAGSGTGALAALGFMYWFPASELPLKISLLGFPAYLFWLISFKSHYITTHLYQSLGYLAIALLSSVAVYFIDYQPSVDPYKSISHLEDLAKQGDAQKIATQYGPRAQIDVYQSDKIHNTLFAGLQGNVMPPHQLSLLLDGAQSGTIFRIDSASEAAIMDYTPQSIPYKLKNNPKVLLLGEVGGTNTWLAKRYDASSITVVQTNPQVKELMKNMLKDLNGNIFNQENVRVISKSPRLFLEQTNQKFDIIQIVTAEGMPASSGGLQSLHENFLLTTDAIQRCHQLLAKNGIVSITRGLQTPPRDNIKIMAMFIGALRNENITKPERYLLQSRNYLAANTLLHQSPVGPKLLSRYKEICNQMGHDTDYFPGITPDSLTSFNTLPGTTSIPGTRGNTQKKIEASIPDTVSYFYYAAQQLLGKNPGEFIDQWIYNVQPPTDNTPYFHNFFKWQSVEKFRKTYGRFWLQRLELGYVVLVITLVEVTFLGLLLILLPLFFIRANLKKAPNKIPALLHFGGIGVGFMLLEMVFMQKFTQFMGDPIYSIAAAMTAILIFAGLGSSIQKKLPWAALSRIRLATLMLTGFVILYLIFLDPLLDQLINLALPLRFFITVICLFPVSFLLGWFFPSGLELLENQKNSLIPWAWGINGFTSVAAAPFAVMLAMSFGFQLVIITALICYLIVAGTSYLWQI